MASSFHARLQHRRQRLRVGQPVIRANFDKRRPAAPRQFLVLGERHHVVGPAVQDDRAGLHRLDRPPFLPGRAKKDEFRLAAVDVHRHGPAPRRADDHLGLVLVDLLLGDLDGLTEVLVRQLRVHDFVAVLGQEGRLDAAWDRLPAVKEEDFHTIISRATS
jgi:hypothetical protein